MTTEFDEPDPEQYDLARATFVHQFTHKKSQTTDYSLLHQHQALDFPHFKIIFVIAILNLSKYVPNKVHQSVVSYY